jgi:hypothetical protein
MKFLAQHILDMAKKISIPILALVHFAKLKEESSWG